MKAFAAYVATLHRSPTNTFENYSRWLARFFDYFFDAVTIKTAGCERVPSHDELTEILETYYEYLVFGGDSGIGLAREVDATNPSPRVAPASAERMHAPLRGMLSLSEAVRKQQAALARAGFEVSDVDDTPLYASRGERPTPGQVKAMQINSMLSGVIAGGPRLLDAAQLPTPLKGLVEALDDDAAFPFDLVMPLIDQFRTARDRALYAFKAASGARISECVQLCWSDLDFRRGTAKLVHPLRRSNIRSLSPTQRRKLSWKGRTASPTLLIEPFATRFWEELEIYRKTEWRWVEGHDFVFQHLRTGYAGLPYFLSARSTRTEIFSSAVGKLRKISGDPRLELDDYGGHSLRHTYGFYLLNYFPRANGTFGLSLELVKDIMGHQKVASTAKYARKDRQLLEIDVAYSNSRIYGHQAAKSITEMQRDVLQHRLEEVERTLENERQQLRLTNQGVK